MSQLLHSRLVKPVLLVAGLVVAWFTLRGRLPDLGTTWTSLRHSQPGWLLAAGVLAVLSMWAFSEQQRHLLGAFGVRMSTGVSLAVTYARAAIHTALPAGAAVSAGYAFRQFRARGATQPIAAAVMLLSGVASAVGLAALYGGELLSLAGPRTIAVVAACALLAGVGLQQFLVRRTNRPPAAWPSKGTVRETITLAATVPVRTWALVILLAAVNWLTDLACLFAAAQAVGLTVSVHAIATAYLATQLVRQIPITPGAVGVIEAALLVAFTSAGAAAAPATAAILLYRVLSSWSVLPIGLACWTAQRPRRASREELDLGEGRARTVEQVTPVA